LNVAVNDGVFVAGGVVSEADGEVGDENEADEHGAGRNQCGARQLTG